MKISFIDASRNYLNILAICDKIRANKFVYTKPRYCTILCNICTFHVLLCGLLI